MKTKINNIIFTILLALCWMTQESKAIELTTLYRFNRTNVEGAIELVNSIQTIRTSIYDFTDRKYNRKPTHINKLLKSSYLIVDFTIFSIGSYITIHEVGHANTFDYFGQFTNFETGTIQNASLFDLYLFSTINGSASTNGYIYISTPYKKAFISGQGTNAGYIQKNKLLQQSLIEENISRITLNDYVGIHLATLIYLSIKPTQSGNDFLHYIRNINLQGHTLNIDNLRTQFILSSILSMPIKQKNETITFRKFTIGNYTFYSPELTPFLMGNAVTQQIELFFRKNQLFSLAYEFTTFGDRSHQEITYGWYPRYKKLESKFRLTVNAKNNWYLNMSYKYNLNKKLSLMTKTFIGNSNTNAQKRESLSKKPIISIGLKYNI
tara:strand:+ start:105 stop:1244 length:1140 start_codon:yes stop_codon:yes gene_type:complete